jgi:hypothetical protein
MESWVDLFWTVLIAVVATAALTFAWAFASAKFAHLNVPYRRTNDGGTIRPWPPLWFVIGIFLALVVAGGAGAAIAEPNTFMIVTMALCALTVGPLALMSVLMAMPVAQLKWGKNGVEGTSSAFWITRRQIAWADIDRVKASLGGALFIEDTRGRRVYWSTAYIGQHYFLNTLVAQRPNLLTQVQEMVTTGG